MAVSFDPNVGDGEREPRDSFREPRESLRNSMTSLDTIDRPGKRKSSFDYRAFMPQRTHGEIEKRYDIDPREYAAGGYGKVFMARDREFGQKQVAIKKVVKQNMGDPKKAETFYREVRIMKELDHPNICKLLETYEHERNMFFVMECCHGGEVFERIMDEERICEQTTADIIKQVASALRYAHARGIAHRDLKPENICFCDKQGSQIKVIDWGLGFYFGQARMSSAVGSLTYAAPEVLEARQGIQYGSACDLWSLGVLAYVMLSGKPPFWGNHSEQLRRMKDGRYPITGTPWDSISRPCKDFIAETLRAKPTDRLAIDKVADHDWFKHTKREILKTEEQREVLSNLQSWKNNSMFFSICVTSVARQLDHSDLKEVHKVFAEMDENGDGVLELHEVKAGFEKLFGKDSQEAAQVEEMFAKIDVDGSGTIDYTEFCAAGIGEQMSGQAHLLWAAFKSFDADDNGSISAKEIAKVLENASVQKAWSKAVCDQVAKELMGKFDTDGDGDISFDEWLEMMRGAQVERVEDRGSSASAGAASRGRALSASEEQDHLLAEIEKAGQEGNMEEAYQLIRRLNEKKKISADSAQVSLQAPATGILRDLTNRLARTITGSPHSTPTCGFTSGGGCAVM